MKKYLFIIIGVVAVGIGVFIFLGLKGSPFAPEEGLPPPSGSIGTGGYSGEKLKGNFPSGSRLVIQVANGSVSVKNFYLLDSITLEEGGTLVIKTTGDYSLIYETIDSTFRIYFSVPVTGELISVAEADLLDLLDVDKNSACRLKISAWSAESSTGRQLSFCGSVFK